MTHVSKMMKVDLLERMMEEGYIRTQTHPTLPLTIYNYTQEVIHADMWNSCTLNCRGLILDDNLYVVARPFAKFFNLGDKAQPQIVVSDHPAQIFDKLDGSLGILWEYEGHVGVATRGSFDSEQAVWATDWLDANNWADGIGHGLYKFWPDGVTPLVEIIYPENRIVVDYKGQEELIMLGAIRHEDGTDLYPGEIQEWWPFSITNQFPMTGIQDVTHMVNSNGGPHEDTEGVVMVWQQPGKPSHRLKVKRADYVVMHRIVTGMNARKVWEMVKDGENIEEVLAAGVPEEFYDWVRAKETELRVAFAKRVRSVMSEFQRHSTNPKIMKNNGRSIERREFAHLVSKMKDKDLYFRLLDNKDISEVVWKELRPGHEVPFGNPEEIG
jgi:RNA ligase